MPRVPGCAIVLVLLGSTGAVAGAASEVPPVVRPPVLVVTPSLATAAAPDTTLVNPAIDMPAYLRVAEQAAAFRATRRLSERGFIRMSRQPGVVVLDARSREKFEQLHVRGARNLSFPDMTPETLRAAIPGFDTPVLIYCNNNFAHAPDPFPRKLASASLNLSTFIALYTYGYRNLYELGPLIDVDDTRIEFESGPERPNPR